MKTIFNKKLILSLALISMPAFLMTVKADEGDPDPQPAIKCFGGVCAGESTLKQAKDELIKMNKQLDSIARQEGTQTTAMLNILRALRDVEMRLQANREDQNKTQHELKLANEKMDTHLDRQEEWYEKVQKNGRTLATKKWNNAQKPTPKDVSSVKHIALIGDKNYSSELLNVKVGDDLSKGTDEIKTSLETMLTYVPKDNEEIEKYYKEIKAMPSLLDVATKTAESRLSTYTRLFNTLKVANYHKEQSVHREAVIRVLRDAVQDLSDPDDPETSGFTQLKTMQAGLWQQQVMMDQNEALISLLTMMLHNQSFQESQQASQESEIIERAYKARKELINGFKAPVL